MREIGMNTFSTLTVTALLAAGSATAAAQTQTSPDPSAASSPHQRQATSDGTSEATPTNGADPASASTPHQHQAMKGSTNNAASVAAGATPTTFVKAAAQDGMTEVELGKLALSKSSNDDVKQFAQKMVQDHGQADQQLTALAKSKGLTVPAKLDAQHEAMVKMLSAKSGAAFDSAYSDHMAKGHTKAVALFESASQSSDADLAAFAKQTLPTLQQHEQLANNLRASVRTRTASAK
jgi:putative membrane protein